MKPTHSMVVVAVLALAACQRCSSSPEDGGHSPITGDGDDGGDDGGCKVGDSPIQLDCAPGCVKDCQNDNSWGGACRPRSGACPVSLNAGEALCLAGGICGRGPCELGFFDFDPNVPGCETKCTNRKCDFPDGGSVTLSNDPLHERSMAFAALSSGASFGSLTQRSDGGYQNVGTLGEVAVGTSSSDGGYTNYGGFMSVGRGPASQRR